MKYVEFVVKEKKSYIKSWGWPSVKKGTKLPLVVHLNPGGSLRLAIDEKKNVAAGEAAGLRFATDRFKASSAYYLTGKYQTIAVNMKHLELAFDSKSGVISSGGGYTFVYGAQQFGGTGLLGLWYLGISSFHDGNSAKFDLSNGLGCGGGLVLEMGTGNPTDFIIHLETEVGTEDTNGDGVIDTYCPTGWWFKFLLEYEPPKLRIIPPDFRLRDTRWLRLGMIEAIPFHDLVKLAAGRRRVRTIDQIELSSADMGLVLLDGRGRVVDGVLSNRRAKTVKIPQEAPSDLDVAIVPNAGMAAMRG